MIWWALFIPVIITLITWKFYKHKIAWWELFVPTTACLIAIVVSYFTMKTISLSDVEYNGFVITEARYYEPYETWVKRTCSYTTCTGSGKTRTCTTHYYDCSYCDHIPAKWVMIDTDGNVITISEAKYNSLIKKWKDTPKFRNLHRNINYHFGCGKDGDMYFANWNKDIMTSETSTTEVGFSNILKCNHSAFNYPIITEEEANKKGLFEYPEISSYNYQNSVLGLDSLAIKKNELKTKLNFLNGKLGKTKKVRVYTLIFRDKSIDISFLQEAYWDGGNQNEIVVCIGTDVHGNINWVRPFSWCDNKRVCIDIREDLSEHGKLDADTMYKSYHENINKFWHYKSFEDFNYLSFEPTTGQLIFVYLFTVLVSIISIIWCIKNNINE